MEIRDMIPSQNQIAIQKNVEVSDRHFKNVMEQKVEAAVKRRESEEDTGAAVEVADSANKVFSSNGTKKTKLAPIAEESSEEVTNDEISTDERTDTETKTKTKTKTVLQGFAVELKISNIENSETCSEDAPETVSTEKNSFFVNTVGVSETMSSDVANVSISKAVRVSARQLYEAHDPDDGAEYVEMLEILAPVEDELPDSAEKDRELTIEPESEFITDISFEETTEPKLEVKIEAEESPELSKPASKNAETEVSDDEVKPDLKNGTFSESKEKGRENSNFFSNIPLSGKTESVRHHDNMVGVAPRMVTKQVVEAISVDIKVLSDGQALEVKLSPEHLGKVVMKIEMKDGQMAASIKVENPEVKSALEASIQELRETLSARGISVKEIHVGVSKDDHRGGQEFARDNRRKDQDEDGTKDFRSVLEAEE